jgi:hypothetical protein
MLFYFLSAKRGAPVKAAAPLAPHDTSLASAQNLISIRP